MDTNKQIKIGNSYGTIPVGSPADPTRTVAQTDAYFQNLSNKNPESADVLMDRYGYTNSPNVITPQALQPVAPINLAGTTPAPTVDTSLVANATQGTQAFDTNAEFQRQLELQKQTTPDQTPLNDILASLTTTEQGLTGRGTEQLNAETSAGIPEAQKTRATLQGTIKSQLAEYEALKTQRDQLVADLEVGTRGSGNADIRASMLFGQQGAVERQYLARLNSKASEIGLLQAQDQALAGQIETAQNTVNRAIDLKYQDKEAEYQIKKLQYDRIKDSLTLEEKKRGEALQNALKKEETALAEQKENEKAIQTLKLKIVENGGNPNLLDKATTIDEAIKLGAGALKTPNNEIRELNGALYMIDKNTGKSKLIAGGGGGGGVGVGGKGSTITKPVSDAINTILGSGKFTKDQATAVRNAINSGEDPLVVIKNNAKNIMGQTEATALGKYETAKQSMTDLDNSLKQYYANGGKTDILKGNYEKVINKLGEVDDPNLVELAVQIQTNLQVYRNAVSGTAYSVQEGKDIASIFPGINKTQGLNQAIISGRQKAFDSTIDGTYKNVLGSTYDKLKSGQSGDMPKSGMSDKDYVEKVLVSKNIKYDDFVNNVPQGQIPVIDNATGQTGYVPYLEFNSSKYTKI